MLGLMAVVAEGERPLLLNYQYRNIPNLLHQRRQIRTFTPVNIGGKEDAPGRFIHQTRNTEDHAPDILGTDNLGGGMQRPLPHARRFCGVGWQIKKGLPKGSGGRTQGQLEQVGLADAKLDAKKTRPGTIEAKLAPRPPQ